MSQLFSAYHAIGLYSQEVPFSILSRGKQHLLATAVDESFHLYSLESLRLLYVGYAGSGDTPVQRLLFHNGRLYVAQGVNIRVWKNGRMICAHETELPASLLLGCGDRMLSVEEGGSVRVWECGEGDKWGEEYLHIEFDASVFKTTSIVHPATYVNKVLFGSHQGSLQLWNIRKNILVYEFGGWGSPVLSLEQSPSTDVIAIGLMDGSIHLHDIKFDQSVLRFSQDSPVTCLSFRRDGDPLLVSGSSSGHLSVWDLERERLRGVLSDAHLGTVTSLSFVGTQEVAVSASTDNSIKMWVFDEPGGLPRLLRSRSGHSAPPVRVRFFSPGGLALLSASRDGTLRIFSLVRGVSLELSQGHTLAQSRRRGVSVESLRLPPVSDFSVELSQADEWDCIASVHAGLPWVQTWHLFKRCVGQHRLKPPLGATPTCVCSSPCGNFVAVGDSDGHVELFNIQSGQHRGGFETAGEGEGAGAHRGPVRGLAINATCSVLFSLGADGVLRFWNFSARKLVWQLPFRMTVSRLVSERNSGLMAVVLDDFSIQIVDAEGHAVVRTFQTPSQTTDLVFSPDARWLVVSLSDATIRTWDIPTGRLIDCFRVSSPVTSLAISPTGEALATAHADSPGVFLWSNRTLYGRVSLRAVDELAPVPDIQLPRSIPEEGTGCPAESEELDEARLLSMEEMDYGEYTSPAVLDPSLLSLTGVSSSHWLSLSRLDIIKERNKPIEPVSKPKQAPFFLPTQPDMTSFSFSRPETATSATSATTKSRVSTRHAPDRSPFLQRLVSGDHSGLMELLGDMGPAGIDGEVRLLGPEMGGGVDELEAFLDFLLNSLEQRHKYELVQSLMSVFLRVHSKQLINHGDTLGSKMQLLVTAQESSWSDVSDLMRFSLCMIEFFKAPTL